MFIGVYSLHGAPGPMIYNRPVNPSISRTPGINPSDKQCICICRGGRDAQIVPSLSTGIISGCGPTQQIFCTSCNLRKRGSTVCRFINAIESASRIGCNGINPGRLVDRNCKAYPESVGIGKTLCPGGTTVPRNIYTTRCR